MDGRTDARTDAHTDQQRENSIPTTNKVCEGYKKVFMTSDPVIRYAKDLYRIWQVQNKADIGAVFFGITVKLEIFSRFLFFAKLGICEVL